MSEISVQFSIFPLNRLDLCAPIEAALMVLADRGLAAQVGTMSTVVSGDDEAVFTALRDAYRAASAYGAAVMTVTVSNACRFPVESTRGA